MSIFRAAITDEKGEVDVADLSLFWVMSSVLGAITFACVMSALAWYAACTSAAHQCAYDPQPLGVAVGSICLGFSTALGALGVYVRLIQPRKDVKDGSAS